MTAGLLIDVNRSGPGGEELGSKPPSVRHIFSTLFFSLCTAAFHAACDSFNVESSLVAVNQQVQMSSFESD